VNDSASPISPDLFNRVDEYTDSILKGAVTSDSIVREDIPIYIFYQNFFLQFFDNVLHYPITGFDEKAQDRAARKRLSLKGPEQAPVRQLITQFENFCDMRTDLEGGLYFASDDDFIEFHEKLIPRLLTSIQTWATSASLPRLAERAEQALDTYNSAVAYLTTSHD
jgi:hypothetical protein